MRVVTNMPTYEELNAIATATPKSLPTYEELSGGASNEDTQQEPPPRKTADEAFTDEVMSHANKRYDNMKKTLQEYNRGDAGAVVSTVAAATQIPGLAIDVVGEVAGEALEFLGDGISFVVPDEIEGYAKEQFVTGANYVMNHPKSIEAFNAAKGGAKKYEIWKKVNPTAARAFEGVVDVGLLITPVKGGKVDLYNVTDSANAGGVLAKGAVGFYNSVGKEVTNENAKHIFKLITPVKPDPSRVRQADNLPKTNNYIFNDAEEETARALARAGVGKGQSAQKAHNLVTDAIEAEAEGLSKRLAKGTVTAPIKNVNNALQNIVNNTKTNQSFITSGNLNKELDRVVAETGRLLQLNGLSPQGILKTRQQLDKFVKNAVGKDTYGNDKVNSLQIAHRNARKELNDLVQDTVDLDPDLKGLNVKESLARQSAMYRGMDVLGEKAVTEGSNRFTRFYKNISALSDSFALPTTPLALGATAGAAANIATGGGIGAGLIAAGVGGVAITVLNHQIRRGTLNKQGRKLIGKSLAAADKAIDAAKQRGLVKEVQALRLDRAYFADLLRTMPNQDAIDANKKSIDRSIEKLEDRLRRWESSKKRTFKSLEGGSNIPDLFRDATKVENKLKRLYEVRESL
tara:strand:+ start:1656 stop:3545 length:1890 start_codon:yes stop_codon:yes gene_type:complete